MSGARFRFLRPTTVWPVVEISPSYTSEEHLYITEICSNVQDSGFIITSKVTTRGIFIYCNISCSFSASLINGDKLCVFRIEFVAKELQQTLC